MSAYVVSKDQISVLVAAGVELCSPYVGDFAQRVDGIGQCLLNECVRSVSHRYPRDDIADLPGSLAEETPCDGIAPIFFAEHLTPYAYAAPTEPVSRERVAETLEAYRYQSSEHPGWATSWACKYTETLAQLLHQLPERQWTYAIGDRVIVSGHPGVVSGHEGEMCLVRTAGGETLRPECELTRDEAPETDYGDLSRAETIRRIRTALRRRSGKAWSVTGGRGTGYGWIEISAPPKRRTGAHVCHDGANPNDPDSYEHVDAGEPGYIMTPADCAELGELLGLGRPTHCQGESVPSSNDYYREYIDRAEGRTPATVGSPYWD